MLQLVFYLVSTISYIHVGELTEYGYEIKKRIISERDTDAGDIAHELKIAPNTSKLSESIIINKLFGKDGSHQGKPNKAAVLEVARQSKSMPQKTSKHKVVYIDNDEDIILQSHHPRRNLPH